MAEFFLRMPDPRRNKRCDRCGRRHQRVCVTAHEVTLGFCRRCFSLLPFDEHAEVEWLTERSAPVLERGGSDPSEEDGKD